MSFGTLFSGGNVWKRTWGPLFNIRKKPCQRVPILESWRTSESEVLALEEAVSDSKLLEQSSRTPLGEDSYMPSSISNELNKNLILALVPL